MHINILFMSKVNNPKKSFELLFLKSQECQGGCVKNASAMLKNKKGGHHPPPPPS